MNEADELEAAMRRLFAAKEMVDVAIESVAGLLARHRPQGGEKRPEMPATFKGAPQPVTGEDGVIESWHQAGTKDVTTPS